MTLGHGDLFLFFFDFNGCIRLAVFHQGRRAVCQDDSDNGVIDDYAVKSGKITGNLAEIAEYGHDTDAVDGDTMPLPPSIKP